MAKGSTNAIIVVGGGGISGFTVPACSNVTARSSSGKIYIKWTDPDDIYDGGKLISWTKSEVRLIVANDSSSSAYPKKVTDGTLVGTFTTKNQYQSTELEFTPPSTIGSDVNCCIMVYAHCSIAGDTKDYINGEYKAQSSAQFKIKSYSTWTVVIDESNSNPLSCCTYADDAVGMTKGSSDWDEIFGYKPCIFYQGAVYKYLNPNDFTKFEDGTDAIKYIADSNYAGYDVMIEFPRMGLTMSKSGTQVTISLTNNPNDNNFEYRAHKRGSVAKNAFYLGAYDATGNVVSGITGDTIGSTTGKSPLTNKTLTQFIEYAHVRGSGYEIMAFYQWTYIQCLYVLKYGNLNSQKALGKGYTDGSAKQNTGATNTQGMCYGNPNSGIDRMKLFGLEDLWGNVYQFISGLYSDSNRNLLTTTDNFGVNTSADAWEYNVSSGTTGSVSGYMTESQGTNNGGFVIKVDGGSSTTYYSDASYLNASNFPYVCGGWDNGDLAGVFRCSISSSASAASSNVGSRLMYL